MNNKETIHRAAKLLNDLAGEIYDSTTDKNDYLAWHAWADVQYKAGIRQKQCRRCGLWRTPQELSTIIDKGTAYTRGGQPVTIEKPVCNNCARLSAARPPDARRR